MLRPVQACALPLKSRTWKIIKGGQFSWIAMYAYFSSVHIADVYRYQRLFTVSSGGTSSLSKPSSVEVDDPDLQKALTMSLECVESEDIKQKRLAYFEKRSNAGTTT